MANGKLSFAVAINLLTDNFKRGASELKAGLRNIQMQALAMVAAFGAGSLGLGEFVSNLIEVARQTNRTSTALKNVSGDWETYAKNQKFLIDLSKKYGLYVNDLVGNYSKFTAAASNANISMKDQQKIYESLSRAATGFGLSADETNGMFLAVTQMMGKGKIQAEELRGQLGERLPIAMQAMAKAAGVSVAGLDKIMKAGKLMSADVLPKFADALTNMMPNVSTDNIETSFNRLKNTFKELTDKLNVGSIYKNLLDQTGLAFQWLMANFKSVSNTIVNVVTSVIIGKGINAIITAYKNLEITALRFYKKQALQAGISFDLAAYNANKFKNVTTLAFAKVGVALKAAFASFAPMLIISGLIAIYQHFSDLAEKQREIKAIWTDFQNGFKNAGKNDNQVRNLQALQTIIYDTNKSLEDRKTALNEINSILGTTYEFDKNGLTIAGDINTKIRERLGLLEKQAELNYLVNKKMEAGDALSESNNLVSEAEKQSEIWGNKAKYQSEKGLIQIANEKWQAKVWKEKLAVEKQKQKENEKVYNSASAKIISLTTAIEKITGKAGSGTDTIITTPTATKETDLQKAEKEYKESLIELTNQKSNSVISDKEYNKAVDELNKKTYEKIGGLISSKDAANNSTFQSAKAGVLNPKTNAANDEFEDVQKQYTESLKDLETEKKLGLINEKEYNSALLSLINSTVKSAFSIDGIDVASSEFIKGLIAGKQKLDQLKVKDDLSKYDYNSPFETTGKTDIEVAGINLEKAKKELEDLKDLALKTTDDLTAQLEEKLANVKTLDKALNLLEVKKQVKDLNKELSTGIYSGVKDIASSAERMYQSFKAVADVISNVDSTGWEKFTAIWSALTNTVDSIMSVVTLIGNLVEITNKLAIAKQAETVIDTAATGAKVVNAGIESAAITTKAGVEIATSTAVTSAYSAQMAAATAAAYAPLLLAGIPLAAAQIAGYEAMIIAASIPKFANGGIVGGSSFTGDKILAGLNSGEMVLNGGQQSTLFNLLNGAGGFNPAGSINGAVEFKIEGKALKGVLSNYDKIKSKV